ncbi:hypothetical protein OG216_38950 [Streptomycetaceae bacterium NBC_01309]
MRDGEPVFKRSKWGTNRYVYNADNRLGLALIVLSSVVGLVAMLMLATKSGPYAIDDEPATRPSPTSTYVPPYLLPPPTGPYLPTVGSTPPG